jgi:2-dehydro-3-deoxy-D-gluconate 5-dehydrogenase
MSMLFSLQGKVAAITGANSGIGQALALGLASAGATIVCLSRSAPRETEDLVRAQGGSLHWVATDFTQVEKLRAAMNEADRIAGGVDVLINNAGTIKRADALEMTEQEWDEVVDLNLKSAFFLSQAFAQNFLKRKANSGLSHVGKIIQIVSMLSFQGGIRVAGYTASKSGLLGITRLLANEWAAKGISVNAIAPGYIETLNTEALRADPKRNADILARIPAGRWGQGEDLAGAAVFLSSPASDYVHGAVLPVDGGWLAR